uniref:Integrator complex subunit 5 C-terminal domain-containing protein n=1 Tax=Meloidogyne enterolobii TaxID=390850 RepID=A0A6V7UFU3_MELEN|nr:unnamed protein product [Meloidogyne enterolobii]
MEIDIFCFGWKQLGKLNMKILHCACILLGNEQTSQLFAQFIHAAKNEKELTNFLSFALTVIPHLNQNQRVNSLSVMTLAVRFAVLDSKKIENGLTEFLQEKEEILLENENCQNKITLERNLLNNLLMIVKWNEQSEQGMILRNIGLNLADIRGYLQEGLLNWMLDYTDLVRKITGGTLNEEAAQVLNTFFTLMLSVVPQVQLPLNFQNNLLTKLSALIVSMLKFIKKEKLGTSLDGVDYFARCCTIAGRIFIKQTGADPTQLMRSLMDEIFESYQELFDSDCCGSNESSRHIGAFLDYSKFRTINFFNKNYEHSIFQELRQASLTDRTAAAVAHSGTLNRKRFLEKFVENKEGEEEENAEIKLIKLEDFYFWILLNVYVFLQDLQRQNLRLLQQQNNNKCNSFMIWECGQLLVDRFAGDGLTSHFCWHSWEQERELVSQYTKITKIIEQHPIVFDFLLLLSELGFTGLCSVIPLFKALFVTVLSQLENTPLKTEKISFAFLQRSSQLIGLFICADIFPRILSTFQKILSNSTNFEAFVLMRDLWDFLKLLIPTCEEITKGKMISFENKTVLEKREGKQLISSIVLVIQRNISLLGEFLYPILELICENDENDWTIEREQKPISVLAEIKRF